MEFSQNFRKGDRVEGQIKSITDFGVFIGLPGGIDGLVHLSDLSWDLPGDVAVRNYRKGEELETTVLAIDPDRERISLGVKQLDKDPLSQFIAENAAGSIVRGIVQEVDARGATITLAEGVITGVDRRHRSVTLSVKGKEASEEAQAIYNYKSEAGKPAAGTTLGDLLKEQMTSDQ